MARALCVSCMLAAAVGVAPPAMMPPPVQPGVLPAGAVVAQMPGVDVERFAATPSNTAANAQFEPRLRGQSPTVPSHSGWASPAGSEVESLRTTSPLHATMDHQGSEVWQGRTASATEWAHSLGALVLAAVMGAVAGGLWWRQRIPAVKSKESATELTASSSAFWHEQSKVAVAAFAGETVEARRNKGFDPLGRNLDLPKHEVRYGRQALVEALRLESMKEGVAQKGLERQTANAAAMSLAAFLVSSPAHAQMLEDEVIPYAGGSAFAILWGIVLGFVLLRLQEAFPE